LIPWLCKQQQGRTAEIKNAGLQRIQAVIQGQKRTLAEGRNGGFLLF